MIVQLPVPDPLYAKLWTSAVDGVNAWRGACIQCFAKTEAAVIETLMTLSAIPARESAVRLRHLGGQRLVDLAMAIGPEGSFAEEGAKAAMILAAFREHESLRGFLAHGTGKVAIDRSGKWMVVLRYVTVRSCQIEKHMLLKEEQEALETLKDLKQKSRKLCAALAILRRSVE